MGGKDGSVGVWGLHGFAGFYIDQIFARETVAAHIFFRDSMLPFFFSFT